MDTFDYLFAKARENGKVAKALSEKLQTEVDKNKIVDEIGNIDVGAIVRGVVKGTGVTFRDIVDTASNISNYKYINNVNINVIVYVNATSVGNSAMQNCLSLTSVDMPNVTSVGSSAMANCLSLTSVNMPNVTSIGSNAMYNCISLVSIDMPNVTSIGSNAMRNCISLVSIDMPNVTSVGSSAMQDCVSLTSVNMPNVTSIDSNAMLNCMSLKSVRLGASQVVTLANTTAFTGTQIANGKGYIYVPDELVEDYKVATNWSVYADQIRPLSECEE